MPSHQLHGEETPAEVLRDIAGLPGIPALEPYRRKQRSPEGFGLENLLAEMQVKLRIDPVDMSRIPATGPVVVVANHPFGMLDGVALAALLTRVRPDVKVMTNYLLRDIPELARHCIFVDPFHGDGPACSLSSGMNHRAVREALNWLQSDGMLAVFPAGEVSQWQFSIGQIADPAWNDTAVRLIRRSQAAVLPLYVCGRSGMHVQILGQGYRRLRTALLLQEFLQQKGRTVEVRVGSEIAAESVTGITDDREALEYLRWRTYLLARRSQPEKSWPAAVRSKIVATAQEPIATAEPSQALAAELNRLPSEHRLVENTELAVYVVKANETPCTLRELGRLREVTFRGAGEGTGNSGTSIVLMTITGMCCCGTRPNKNSWALIVPAIQPRFLRNAELVGSTPARCFAMIDRFSRSSARHSNWAGRSSGRNISANTLRCFCCGRELRGC